MKIAISNSCIVRAVLFGLLLGSTGCGPMYDTRYTFVPPESQSGRTCTFQCENSKMQCQQIEQMRNDTCEERARIEQQQCQWNMQMQGKKEKWYDCGLSSCSEDTERCESQYRSCFQMCGGTVRSETVCIANCDQIPRQELGR